MNLTNDSPIATLAAAIEETALRCAEPLQERMDFPTDDEQKEKWFEILWEHIFLLMHLVNRNAYGTLEEETHRRLINELVPMVVLPLVLEVAEGRPDDIKERITREALEGLNRSEREYSECERFLAEPMLTGKSVVSVFARKVNHLAGGSLQPAQMAEIVRKTVEAYRGLTLKERMGVIAGYLRPDEPAAG